MRCQLTLGKPYTGDEADERSRSSAIALSTFGRSRACGLRVGTLGVGGPRISNCDIVVDSDSVEFLRLCLGLLLGSRSELVGGGIMTGSSGMFFRVTLLSTADKGGDGDGGGGAISCGGGSRMRPSSIWGIQPSGGMSTGGCEGERIL